MRKGIKQIGALFGIIALSFIINFEFDDFFMNTIFTVVGIMFSIGIGLVVTFNLHGIKNKDYIRILRKNLNEVRNTFIKYFTISTSVFILDKYTRDKDFTFVHELGEKVTLSFNISFFFLLVMLYSIIYYIVNFLSLQKLNDEIFDELNQ